MPCGALLSWQVYLFSCAAKSPKKGRRTKEKTKGKVPGHRGNSGHKQGWFCMGSVSRLNALRVHSHRGPAPLLFHLLLSLGPPPIPLPAGATTWRTLVYHRKVGTAFVAFSFSKRVLIRSARGCFHPIAFRAVFHTALLWGSHDSHLTKRWCRVLNTLRPHHQRRWDLVDLVV